MSCTKGIVGHIYPIHKPIIHIASDEGDSTDPCWIAWQINFCWQNSRERDYLRFRLPAHKPTWHTA